MRDGVNLIMRERNRQLNEEGWDTSHDDAHDMGELARAAACYAVPRDYRTLDRSFVGIPIEWPFEDKWWKPTPEVRIRELVKAGALIAAEIDRLQRLAKSKSHD